MEIAEAIAVGFMEEEVKEKCPFKESEEGVDSEDEEGIEDDDRDEVQEEQQNNGGTLGGNLEKGSPGKDSTVGGPFPPPEIEAVKANDTKRSSIQLRVPATDNVEEGIYPFSVAAHHLIPGNAALGNSQLYNFLGPEGSGKLKKEGSVRKRKKVRVGGITYEIKKHIGYNVNGSHNGAWLPGNYAIRKYKPPTEKRKKSRPNTSPVGGDKGGKNWGELGDAFDDWKLHYVASACKIGAGQFHDTHETYSERVLTILDKISSILKSHLKGGKCTCCGNEKVPPPFTIKSRLYGLSKYLHSAVTGGAPIWKAPWFSSDHWSSIVFSDKKIYKKFLSAWMDARKEGK